MSDSYYTFYRYLHVLLYIHNAQRPLLVIALAVSLCKPRTIFLYYQKFASPKPNLFTFQSHTSLQHLA